MAPLGVPCFWCSALNHVNVGCFCCFFAHGCVGYGGCRQRSKTEKRLLSAARWMEKTLRISFKLDACSVQNGYFRGEKTKEQGNNTEMVVKNINMFFNVKWSPVIQQLQQFLHQCAFFMGGPGKNPILVLGKIDR